MNTSKLTLVLTLAMLANPVFAQEPTEGRPRKAIAPPAPQAPREPREPQPPREPRSPGSRELEIRELEFDDERRSPGAFGGGSGGNRNVNTEYLFDPLTPLREMFGGGPTKPLVISATSLASGDVTSLEEDLEVMSRILEKAVTRESGDNRGQRYMGIKIPGFSAGRSGQSLYVDGYGALFVLNVSFPLADAGKSSDNAENASNSAWEEARREVRGGPQPPAPERSMKYSAEKVESLKKELVATLKNATNIRGLKSEEFLVVTLVSDGGAPSLPRVFATARDGKSAAAAGSSVPRERSDKAGRSTTMTLRVKKSDADAFAKEQIDLEAFESKVTIATY